MSNTIYPSKKVMPYGYIGTHKVTCQFYIGFRCANKKPADQDLGTYYFTTSKRVKDEFGFENFNWIIVAEFFNEETRKKDAYEFEQELIGVYLTQPLNLNLRHDTTGKWSTIGVNIFKNKTLEEKAEIINKKGWIVYNLIVEKEQITVAETKTPEVKKDIIKSESKPFDWSWLWWVLMIICIILIICLVLVKFRNNNIINHYYKFQINNHAMKYQLNLISSKMLFVMALIREKII
jgi:hypothetical protein